MPGTEARPQQQRIASPHTDRPLRVSNSMDRMSNTRCLASFPVALTFDEFRVQLASPHTENLIALLSIISIIQSNTPSLHKVFQAQQYAVVQQHYAEVKELGYGRKTAEEDLHH